MLLPSEQERVTTIAVVGRARILEEPTKKEAKNVTKKKAKKIKSKIFTRSKKKSIILIFWVHQYNYADCMCEKQLYP